MRKQKKLSLKKTTLRNLQSSELQEATGGVFTATVTVTCQSFVGSCKSYFYPDGCWCNSGGGTIPV